MLKSFLFDYGGTLDTAATHWFYVFQQAYLQQGLAIEEPQLRHAYVKGERTLARERIIMPEDNFRVLLEKKIEIQVSSLENELNVLSFPMASARKRLVDSLASYCDNFAHSQVRTSAQTLDYLKNKYKLVMVSNFYGNLHAVLQSYGIIHYFNEIIESAVVGVRKPSSEIWQLGVDAANSSPADCVAVGDSYGKDIMPAHSIGCQTVWFKGKEWEEKDYDESLPSHIITKLSQIQSIY